MSFHADPEQWVLPEAPRFFGGGHVAGAWEVVRVHMQLIQHAPNEDIC